MSENKRMLTLFISIIIVVGAILLIALWPEPDRTFTCGVKADEDYSKLGSVNYEQYECLKKQDNNYALAITDGLSDNEKKALNKAAEESGRGIYYLSDELSNSDLKSIKKELKTDKVSYDNSALVIANNKKVIEGLDKNLNKNNEIYDFLISTKYFKFTCGTQPDEDYPNLAKLTYDQFECLYNSNVPFVMVITQSTCSYCHEYLPVLNEYALENDVPAYILEINTLDGNYEDIISKFDYFEENEKWGTPLTMAIKDKKLVDQINGYTNESKTIDNLFKEIELK